MKRNVFLAVLSSTVLFALNFNFAGILTQDTHAAETDASKDAVMDAQTPRPVPITRPEQKRNDHDQSKVFEATTAPPASTAFEDQPDDGKVLGFDFYRDPLNAKTFPKHFFPNSRRPCISFKTPSPPETFMRRCKGLIYYYSFANCGV